MIGSVKKRLCRLVLAMTLAIAVPAAALTTPPHSPAEMRELRTKANAGDVSAMLSLGDAYNYGFTPGRKSSTTKAMFWYQKAADLGDAEAQTRQGEIYVEGGDEYGGKVPRDEAKGFALFRQAAEKGDITAQADLARLWENATSVSPDYTQAYYWCVKAAQQGHYWAMERLDSIYTYGDDVKSYTDAFERLTKDAVAGSAEAQWRLGEVYAAEGPRYDSVKALAWLQKSADQNSPKGLYHLAIAYLGYSKIAPEDVARTESLMKRSADMGYIPAQLYWARNYMGDDATLDPVIEKKIIGWWQVAAGKDYWEAQETLSYYYAQGSYVVQDGAEAWKWHVLSYRSPYRKRFYRTGPFPMPSFAEMAEGKRRANEWLLIHSAPYWPRSEF